MKVFVTGATGFIGSHLAKRLSRSHHRLRCLVRKTSQANFLGDLGAELTVGDVTDRSSLLAGMAGCDWVIHLANLYTFWEPDKRAYTDINITGTRNVMECALETGVSKVVHVSTVGVYGKPAVVPFTEDSPVGPVHVSEYFRTKYEGDIVAWDLHRQKGLPLVVVYPCSVLGPGDTKATGQYILNLIRRKMPARVLENAVLTFVHVGDVAESIVRAAEKENNIGEKYLIGKFRLSFGELNRMISDIAGVPLPRMHLPYPLVRVNAVFFTLLADLIKRPPIWGLAVDQIRVMKEGFQVDGSKAERELGITYTPIRTALEEAIASYRI